LHAEEYTNGVDVDQTAEVVERVVNELRLVQDAWVVHQDVDPAVGFERYVDNSLPNVFVVDAVLQEGATATNRIFSRAGLLRFELERRILALGLCWCSAWSDGDRENQVRSCGAGHRMTQGSAPL
jgi:hypothetical protein